MVTKQLKQKDASGKETILDFGADAANVDENDTRMFVTKIEKENIGKALTAAESAGRAVTDVSNKIGTTGDTGGSQTAGTVMGKLNKVIANTEAAAENTEAFASIKCGSITSAQEVTFAFKEINAIANDSENDLTITLYNAAGTSAGKFVIKQDETLSTVRFAGSKIGFSGTAISARYILLG